MRIARCITTGLLVWACAACGGQSQPQPVPYVPPTTSLTVLQVSDAEHMVGEVRFPAPMLVEDWAQGERWTRLQIPGCGTDDGAAGEPAIPVFARFFAVPQGATPQLLSVQPRVGRVLQARLWPRQPLAGEPSTDVDRYLDTFPPDALYRGAPFAYDPAAYARSGAYPETAAKVTLLGSVRGMQIGVVTCAAGAYDAAAQSLHVYERVEFEIGYLGGNGSFFEPRGFNAFEVAPDAWSGPLLNYDAVARSPRLPGPVRACAGEELLILTHPVYRIAAETLAAWKNGNGLLTSVFEVNDGAGPGPDTREEIDAFIDTRYENCTVRPSYVLLFGDHEDVPTWIIQRLIKDPGVVLATDYPYATYNTPPEAHDMKPDFAVGRLAVTTEAEADIAVANIIAYEGSPPFNPAFYGRAAIASYFECCNTGVPEDGRQVGKGFIGLAEYARNHLMSAGYGVRRIYTTDTGFFPEYTGDPTPRYYSNGTLLPQDLQPPYPWDGDKVQVAAAFNEGRSLMIHLDHGGTAGWSRPAFSRFDLGLLSNAEALPFVLSANCSSGRFDEATCFAESITRYAGGGAIGVLAFSRMANSLYLGDCVRGVLGGVLPQNFPTWKSPGGTGRQGNILNNVRAHIAYRAAGEDPTSVAYLNAVNHVRLINLLGDPSLHVYSEYPFDLPGDMILYPKPTFLEIHYAVNGAVITALQQTATGGWLPIGRCMVQDGVAILPQVHPPEPGAPIAFTANAPNAVATALK